MGKGGNMKRAIIPLIISILFCSVMRVEAKEISADDVDLLARLIQAECGADWCSDELQLYVGSVVLNRVRSPEFPEDIRSVIYQKGQYSTTEYIDQITPSDRAIENAEYLLEFGSVIDSEYVFQANFKQGTDIIEVQGVYFGKGKWVDMAKRLRKEKKDVCCIYEWEQDLSCMFWKHEKVSRAERIVFQM
jgi:hypothetical protein